MLSNLIGELRSVAAIAGVVWFAHKGLIGGQFATYAILAIVGVINLSSMGLGGFGGVRGGQGTARLPREHIPTNPHEH